MAAGQGNAAAAEFQKIPDHSGVVLNFLLGSLARLQLARAYALSGDTAKAKSAYKDFLTAGNLYGTTNGGGASGAGVVFKVNAAGQETVLHTFTGGADGGNPYVGVILGPEGNLYGTTAFGGQTNAGVVFEIKP